MDDRIALIAAEQRSALFGCEGCSPAQDPHFLHTDSALTMRYAL